MLLCAKRRPDLRSWRELRSWLDLGSWERIISGQLRRLHLERIRTKLLAFSVLATLIPSFSTAWVSYAQNKRSLEAKLAGELQTVSVETAREIDLWLKERLYDLRVFASSYEVSENLDRRARGEGRALRRLSNYLASVREHFSDYEELMVADPSGRPVATSAARPGVLPLPSSWLNEIRATGATLSPPYWDGALGRVVMIAAVPIRLANGQFVGALKAKLQLRTLDDVLTHLAPSASGQLYLIMADGTVITRSGLGSTQPMRTKLPVATMQALQDRETTTIQYSGLDQVRVIGTLKRVPRLNWRVVAEIPVRQAFRQVARLRNETFVIVLALLVGLGSLAYVLGLLIVRPLNRLARGAAKVAAGNLAVDLPVTGGGEVGYLTEVFNHMVARLRESHEELEQLSVTDGLTKLYNRRHLMETLANEIQRCRRHKRVLTVLMADVDEFKKYNDAFGHLAGDHVLTKVATVLRASTREVDCVARYGGEEFVLVLPETKLPQAVEVAERVRTHLAAEEFGDGAVTLSIGIAEFPTHGDSPESVIASADAAMYEAKHAGRNRIARAGRAEAQSGRRRA
jgi:diguanylate cyclase (GGDEF)-like protein